MDIFYKIINVCNVILYVKLVLEIKIRVFHVLTDILMKILVVFNVILHVKLVFFKKIFANLAKIYYIKINV